MKKLFSILLLVIVLPAFGQVASWEFVESQSISSQDINTTPIEINNLRGDTYDYKLFAIFYNGGTNQNIFLGCNSDQTGTNYRRQYIRGTGSTANADVSTSSPIYWTFIGTNSSYQEFLTATITGSSGNERAIDTFQTAHFSTTPYVIKESDYWQNTADEVNQIEIWSNTTTAVSGEVYVFQRPKSGVYNAEDWEIVERVELQESAFELLLHCNGTDTSTSFPDSSKNNFTVTAVGNAQVDTAQKVFGTGSLLLDGSDKLTIPDDDALYLSGDFTLDARVRFNTINGSAENAIMGQSQGGGANPKWIWRYFDGNMYFHFNNGTGYNVAFAWTASTATWYHLRLCRSGNNWYFFVNGTQTGGTQSNSQSISNVSSVLNIGEGGEGGNYIDGWLDEIAIVNGVAMSTTNFTSPTSEYTGDEANIGRNLNTDPIDYLVQGDDEEYLLESYVDNDLLVRLNSDTGTNYTEQLLYNNAGTLTASTSATDTSIQIATDTQLLIKAKTGQYRPCLLTTGQTIANQQTEAGYWWRNTADAITNIGVSDGTSQNSTGKVTLYKRKKFKSSINAHERLIEEYDISGDFSAGYTFKNLPTDENVIYKAVISAKADSTAEDLNIRINGDSGSNYNLQELTGTSTTASASNATGTAIDNMKVDSTYPILTELYIFPSTGKYRPILQKITDYSTNTRVQLIAGWWLNTSDNIQDILFYATSTNAITGKISLYKINLK
jgi:hypothetical protein